MAKASGTGGEQSFVRLLVIDRMRAELASRVLCRRKKAASKGAAKPGATGAVSRGEDASVAARRERMAAAAEARARALQAATAQQQLW